MKVKDEVAQLRKSITEQKKSKKTQDREDQSTAMEFEEKKVPMREKSQQRPLTTADNDDERGESAESIEKQI